MDPGQPSPAQYQQAPKSDKQREREMGDRGQIGEKTVQHDRVTIIAAIVTQPEHEPSRVVGATLGRYRIDGFIGEGGMGQVYRAFDATLGRSVAIKILPERILHDSDRLERFVREARTASSLNHPNVVTIHEIGSATLDGAEIHFMAMELLDGETLRQRLSRERIEVRRAIEWMAQVADGGVAGRFSPATGNPRGLLVRIRCSDSCRARPIPSRFTCTTGALA